MASVIQQMIGIPQESEAFDPVAVRFTKMSVHFYNEQPITSVPR